MYCDFNPRLFKPFTSMKKKIQPAMADDWEIQTGSYNTNSGFIMHSKKLDQKVADIELRRFLDFSKKQNLVIEGLRLKGSYVIGNDRSVYTEEMFETWKNKYEKRTENIIDKKDYKVGHKYKTPCGAELVYLGFKYISKINQDSMSEGDYSKFTKVTKKYFVANPGYLDNASILNQKFTIDLGEFVTKEKVEKSLEDYYHYNQSIVCFSNTKPKKELYSVQDVEIPKEYLKNVYRINPLLVESKGIVYPNIRYRGSKELNILADVPKFDVDSLKFVYYESNKTTTTEYKFLRICIV